MKNSVGRALLLVLVTTATVIGQAGSQESHSYPFARFPVHRLYRGKPAQPKLTTPTQREFRTVLRNGAKKGPNFAGQFTVVEWGCGSNCVVFAVIDARTGKVFDNDMPLINDEYPCGLSYRVESTLFVVEKSSTPDGTCQPELYNWVGSAFVPAKVPTS
jgi:hypothetical protein